MSETEGVHFQPFNFGFSMPPGHEPENWPELPECFEVLELPGGALDLPLETVQAYLDAQEFERVNFRDLAPGNLSAQVTLESGVIVQEYKTQLRRLSELAHRFHAATAGLNPDWETIVRDPDRVRVLNDIFQSTAGDREYYHLEFNLAVRMPGAGTVAPVQSLNLLNRLSGYRVKLALDINPHEMLAAPPDWHKVLTPFRFEVSTVRLCYESELGNQLLYKHIAPILQALCSWRREINLYFAPSGRADLHGLADVVQQANRELP